MDKTRLSVLFSSKAIRLFAIAALVYLPGIGWGLPEVSGQERITCWAGDELGGLAPLIHLRALVIRDHWMGSPQYPLLHYVVLGAFYVPYLLFQFWTDNLTRLSLIYPFGFVDPVSGVQTLYLIARFVSVLMGAGVVAVTYFTALTFWNRTTAFISSVLVMLMYPMFYYSRTSNVDVPALFWCSLVFLGLARILRHGLTYPRAVAIGVFAALAVASKDPTYAVLLFLPISLLASHFRNLHARGESGAWNRWKVPLAGLATSAAVYVFASGLALRPEKYFAHLRFIGGEGSGYFTYPATLGGYWELLMDSVGFVAHSLNWPVFLAGLGGVILTVVRKCPSRALLWVFPGLFFGALLPSRVVHLRYVIVWSFLIAFFAGYALAAGLQSSRRNVRALCGVALLAGCGVALLRGGDVTYLLLKGGSREMAGQWFAQNARPRDRVEYFGDGFRVNFFPRLRPGVTWLASAVRPSPGQGRLQGEFVLTIDPADGVLVGSRSRRYESAQRRRGCPPWAYEGLKNRSLGYELGAAIYMPSLFDHPDLGINPGIEIYVRRDHPEAQDRTRLDETSRSQSEGAPKGAVSPQPP